MPKNLQVDAAIWNWLFRLSVLALLTACATGGDRHARKHTQTTCISPKNPQGYAVYLHGYDGQRMSSIEETNYKNLEKLANSLNIGIAVPRSRRFCRTKSGKKRCWGTGVNRQNAVSALKAARQASSQCFGSKKDFGIIGFGQGGYMASHILSYCLAPSLAPKMKWIVTAGSSRFIGGHKAVSRGLQYCRPITMIGGKRDRYNFATRQDYFRYLQRRGARASIIVFDGGHILPFGPTLAAVRKYTDPRLAR